MADYSSATLSLKNKATVKLTSPYCYFSNQNRNNTTALTMEAGCTAEFSCTERINLNLKDSPAMQLTANTDGSTPTVSVTTANAMVPLTGYQSAKIAPLKDLQVTTAVQDGYAYADGVVTVTANGDYTIKNTNPATPTTDHIVVAPSFDGSITLNGVNIAGPTDDPSSPSNYEFCAFSVDKTAKLTVQLQGTNTLVSGRDRAGLEFNNAAEGAYLLIKNAEDATPGTLKAKGGHNGAGIGSAIQKGTARNITIQSGIVEAQSNTGAGIGGGYGCNAENISIEGGTVTATGNGGGAGIGGGLAGEANQGNATGITISGGTVTARGNNGAGIGGGVVYYAGEGSGNATNITISGGTVTASSSSGTGIGGGNISSGYTGGGSGTASNITISGGTVTATSARTAALGVAPTLGGGLKITASTSNNGADPTPYVAADIATYKYLKAELLPAHSHCVCGGTTDLGDHKDHTTKLTYTPWAGGEITYTDNVASVYLTQDVTLTSSLTVASGQTLNLCLNGYKLDAAGGGFSVTTNNGTLNLCDCNGSEHTYYGNWNTGRTAYTISSTKPTGTCDTLTGGIITGCNNQSTYGAGIHNAGTANLYGGNIAGNTALYGGGVYNEGTVTLSGASIVGNTAEKDGGGVYNKGTNAKLTVNGTASITGNTAPNGGGIYVDNGTATLLGGSITGNTATTAGGGVYYSSGYLTVGGTISITGNSAQWGGGGVFVGGDGDGTGNKTGKSNVNLSGAVTISGNKKGTAANNLYLSSGKTVNITGELTNPTPIGVTMQAAGVFTSGTAVKNSDYAAKFTSEGEDCVIVKTDDDQLKLTPYLKDGDKQSVDLSSAEDLTATSSANFADFESVKVGKQGTTPDTLAAANYTVTSGSTIVTLKNSYLKTLSAGTYTLDIVSTTGTVSATFTITGSSSSSNNDSGSSYDYYNIKITKDGNGTISPDGGYDDILSVLEWMDSTFTFTPDKGYVVSDVLVDGKSIGAKASYTFKDVIKDHTLKVVFKTSGTHVNPQTGVDTASASFPSPFMGMAKAEVAEVWKRVDLVPENTDTDRD